MAARRIVLIQGHPDASVPHLCHALAEAYAVGAQAAGHDVRRIEVAQRDFSLLRSQHDWEHGDLPPALRIAQDDMAWAQHLVFFYPLWIGDMPALLKGFLEQVARPDFAFKADGGNPYIAKGLAGRSARVVITMAMPTFGHQVGAHSARSIEHNVLGFVGVAPVEATLIGEAEKLGEAGVAKWLADMRALGGAAA